MSYAEYMQKEIKKIGTHNKGRGAIGWTRPSGYVTNTEFAAQNDGFKAVCEKVGLLATKRQASKWRRKFGTAYRNRAN